MTVLSTGHVRYLGEPLLTLGSMTKRVPRETPPSPTVRRIWDAMRLRGFSQRGLEGAAGFSRGYLTRLLDGERPNFKTATLVRLADALHVRAGWLATGEGAMETEAPAADPYPALTAAASFARLSDDFPDRALLEEVLRDASARVHHETAEGTGSSDAMLKWLRRLYIVAESRRTPEGQQAEQLEREASATTAASRPRLVDRLPPRTKTAPRK